MRAKSNDDVEINFQPALTLPVKCIRFTKGRAVVSSTHTQPKNE